MSETTEGVINAVQEDCQDEKQAPTPSQPISSPRPPENEALKSIEEEDLDKVEAPQIEESKEEEKMVGGEGMAVNPTETETIQEELPKDYDNSQSVKTRNTMPQQATTNEQMSKLNNSQESSQSSVGQIGVNNQQRFQRTTGQFPRQTQNNLGANKKPSLGPQSVGGGGGGPGNQLSLDGGSEATGHVSLGRGVQDREKLLQDQMEQHGINAILALEPDTWKNIPAPIINAIKLMITASNKTHKKLFDTQMLMEEMGQRQSATALRINKEMQRTTERIEGTIKLIDKNQTRTLNEFKDEQEVVRVHLEQQLDYRDIINLERFKEVNEQIAKMSEDAVIRAWTTDEIEKRALEVQTTAKTDHDTLQTLVNSNQDQIQKYVKQKFDFIQAKQFTVPKIVGSGKEFAFDYLGEYLEHQHNQNKDKLQNLDEFTTKMRANLDKLQEFVEYQLTKDVPEKLKNTSDKFSKSLKTTELELKDQINSIQHEMLPSHKIQIDKLEYNLHTTREELNRMIQVESDGTGKNIKACQEMIEKVSTDVEYLSNQLLTKGSEMELQKESLTKRIQEHIMELRANFDKNLNEKVETLHNHIQEHSQILTQKIAETLETITGSPVSLALERNHSEVPKDLHFNVQQTPQPESQEFDVENASVRQNSQSALQFRKDSAADEPLEEQEEEYEEEEEQASPDFNKADEKSQQSTKKTFSKVQSQASSRKSKESSIIQLKSKKSSQIELDKPSIGKKLSTNTLDEKLKHQVSHHTKNSQAGNSKGFELMINDNTSAPDLESIEKKSAAGNQKTQVTFRPSIASQQSMPNVLPAKEEAKADSSDSHVKASVRQSMGIQSGINQQIIENAARIPSVSTNRIIHKPNIDTQKSLINAPVVHIQQDPQIVEKFDHLQTLFMHSLLAIQKLASAVDSLPKQISSLQKDPTKKIKKQEFNFEAMIKGLIDNQLDIKIRKSNIMLSSFNSYFKKVIKVQHPRSASSGSRTAPAAGATTDHSEEEHRNRNRSKIRKIMDEHHAATHDNPLNNDDNNNPSPQIQNNSFMSHLQAKKSTKNERDHVSRRSKSNTNFFKQDNTTSNGIVDQSQSLMFDTYEGGHAPVPVSEVRFNKNTSQIMQTTLPPIIKTNDMIAQELHNALLLQNQQQKVQKIQTQLRDANVSTNLQYSDRLANGKPKPIAIKYEAFKEMKPLSTSKSPNPRK